jgi:hypothetical protein
MLSPIGNYAVMFSVLFAPYDPFGVVQAPLFIWLAVVGLLIGTFGFLLRLFYLIQQEQYLYTRIVNRLRDIKATYGSDLRNGLPLTGYDAMGQCFDTTPLAPFWDIFAAQCVRRYDATGTERFWTSESATTVFNEAAVLEPRLNRNFYTAIPGMATGFGLLCTFIAILVALLGVQLGENHQFTGLDTLVSGLSGKFVSSIVALLVATIFVPFEKRFFHNLTKSLHDLVAALDALAPRLTPTHVLDEIRSYMEEQSTAFKHFNSDLSTKLKQCVEEGMGPTRDRMVGALEELNQMLRAAEAQKSDTITGSLDGLLQNLGHSLPRRSATSVTALRTRSPTRRTRSSIRLSTPLGVRHGFSKA